MIRQKKKARNLARARISLHRKKGAYAVFYWCTHLRFKANFQKKKKKNNNNNNNPNHLKSAYARIWTYMHLKSD